jgi:hypothetical protein
MSHIWNFKIPLSFIFNQNNFGFADTNNSNDKIKTIDSFSLGGAHLKVLITGVLGLFHQAII